MKKKLAKITGCLLCLAMLFSMAAPAVAAAAEARLYDDLVFGPDMEIIDEIPIDAPEADGGADVSATDSLPADALETNPFAETGEYEIYPTPHSVTYATGTVTLPATMQVTYGTGIDQYTKDRAVEAFREAGVTLSESATTSVKLQVRIDAAGLPDKTGAHTVTVDAGGVTVVGADTDAAFYGLTTMKRILQQVSNKQVKHLTVEDYADVAFRGFIEGYYGQPWTTEDRVELMKFGGEMKMNIYFYAPKNDPKHNSQWREPYTNEEIENLIKPLAVAGEKSKCRFGYALHCFMHNAFRFDTEEHYQEDLEILKAKYLQGIKAGARQIALLADDASIPSGALGSGNEGGDGYVKLLNDLTAWLASDDMQTTYPGLQTTIPFCPEAYGNGTGNHAQLKKLNDAPEGVSIIMTGGAVYGTVNSSFLSTFKNNVGRGAYLWINWPCSDNVRKRIMMLGQDKFLRTGVDPDTVEGIMLNPMQQSEPSKVGIFCNADYAWNLWTDEAHGFQVWNDSFKYVENNSAIGSAEADAFRLLSQHMGYNIDGRPPKTDESQDMWPLMTAFRTAMESDSLTAAQISELRAEYQKIYDAVLLYKNKTTGNQRILGKRDGNGYPKSQEQLLPWLDCAEEFTQATLDLLDALKLSLENTDGSNDSAVVQKYLSGQSLLAASQNHALWSRDNTHDFYVTPEFGGQRLVPFTNDLLAKVAETARTIVDPTVLIERVITNRTDAPEGGLDAMRDGDASTAAIFKDPNTIAVGEYVGVQYNRPITINSVKFEVGRPGNDNDTFNDSKLQYLNANGTWTDIPNATFAHSDLVLEVTGLNLNAKGVRAIATSERTGTWFGVKEITIGSPDLEKMDSTATDAEKYTVSAVTNSDNMSIKGGSLNNAIDTSPSTDVQFAESPYKGGAQETHDKVPAGAWVRVDLGEEKTVGRVVIVQNNSDRMKNAVLEYSTDGTNYVEIASSLNTDTIDQDTGSISARYIRFRNGTMANGWVRLGDFSVYAPVNNADKIAYQSDAVKRLVNPVGTLAEDSASFSADNVMLRPGEFVGIALPGLRAVTDIVAEYTEQPGLVLKAGPSEAELTEITPSAPRAQLLALDGATLVRYVRLENESEQTLSFVLDELSVQYESTATPEITFVETNVGTDNTYYNSDDARPNNKTGAWFDGNLDTTATYATPHTEGEYVLYDLGQTMTIKKLDAVISSSAANYVRFGELQISADGENWTPVVDIATTATDDRGGFDTSPVNAGWDNYSVPNYSVKSGTIAPTEARYLRLYITKTLSDGRFPALGEIVINDDEYVSVFNDPSFTVDPIEPGADFTPDKLIDGDLTTGFKPNMEGRTSGSLVYRLSDKTDIGQINLVQGNTGGVQLAVRPAGAADFNAPTALAAGLNEISVPDSVKNVAEIKLTWGNVTPTFYELIPISREQAAAAGGQAPSEVETVPINSYSGDARVVDFDENWKFNLGDASGASEKVYNDAAWRTVNLPHDFSIEQDYTSSGEAESGYLPGGTGWYRKSFTVGSDWADKVISIDFGGAYMETEVYLNGHKLGENKNGYNPFSFVLPAEHMSYTGENVIAVKVVNTVPSSRWYSGSGIYRSVHLTVTEPIHVARYGTYVTTEKGSGNAWTVNIKTDVQNDADSAANVTVEQAIYELDSATYEKGAKFAENASAASAAPAAGATASVTQTISVQSPKLWNSWDKGEPNLYVLVTTVKQGSTVVDTYETEFGFRTIEFTTDVGFKLNGVSTKLKGVCQHHDQGALGAEAWYRAMERQVEILMDMGCNSIRVTHNPADDGLIEICNRKGILIIDEAFDCWDRSKNSNSNDFARFFNVDIASDNAIVGGQGKKWYRFVLESMINRDKNAPCVIMYSLGNEILATSPHDGFITYATNMCGWAEALDPTRPVTMGDDTRSYNLNGTSVGERVNKIIGQRGVVGFNYCHTRGRDVMFNAHNNGWAMYGSETASHVNSRGVYKHKSNNSDGQNDRGDGLLTSYDKSRVGWGDTAAGAWWYTIRFDYNMGEYVWTGFDYIGEPTPYNGTGSGQSPHWYGSFDKAAKSSYFGIIDTNGIPKDNYYLYRAMWNETDTTLHVLPTWDREDLVVDSNGKVEVVVYSNAATVRVYLNGEEVGASQARVNRSYTGFANGAGTGEGVYTYRTYETAALQNGGTNTFQAGSTAHSGDWTGTAMYSTFMVPYEEGTLEVKAFDANGREITDTVGRDVVRTTSGASKLVATADRKTIRNDGKDLSYVTIDVVDAKGEIVNGATPEIKVSVTGDGVFMGLDNGVQPDHTPYHSDTRKAGAGRLVAIIQSTKKAGSFTVTATSAGLTPAAVQVSTGGAVTETGNDAPVSYDLSKTIYVQLHTAPELPAETTVTLGNGRTVTGSIAWNDYDEALLSAVGEFAISGSITIPGYTIPVSVGVVVLDDVVALLNYSAAVKVGEIPILPDSRPAVMADGTVVAAQFAVTWDLPESAEDQAKLFKKAGKVIVNGSAQVFGKEYSVTATIRVAAPTYMEGGEAVVGTTYYQNGTAVGTSNGTRPAWTDGDVSTVTSVTGNIGYFYDTAQNVYKISLTYQGTPPAGGVTFFYSGSDYVSAEAADNWQQLRPATTTVNGNTVTYQLAEPCSALTLKFSFASEVNLAEALLTTGLAVFDVGSTAELDGMSINGEEVPAAKLVPGGVIKTPAINGVINPISSHNVAVTLLPEDKNSRIVIVTESEDHSQRTVYTVQLDASENITDAGDDSMDYPFNKTTATAPSQNSTSGNNSASAAVDDSASTIWHTSWGNGDQSTLGSQPERRYIQLELEEETSLTALRYLPRSDGKNGRIIDYEVWVSTADTVTAESKNTFTKVSEGEWAANTEWKLTQFTAPVNAKYVRLYGVRTQSDKPAETYVSAAEVRLVKAPDADQRIDLSEAVITLSPTEFPWKNIDIEPGSGAEGATVTVTLRGRVLEKGVDYTLDYENNVDPGTAYLYAKALPSSTKYRGTAATTFTIKRTDDRITDFRPITIRVQPGVDPTPQLPATVMAFTNAADGQPMEVPVIWEHVPEEWYIAPPDIPKERVLYGDVEDPDLLADPTLRPTITMKIAFSQSVDTVSMVTAVGVVPALPSTVTVRFDDGTSAERTVQRWYLEGDATKAPLTSAAFTAGRTVTILGDVTGIDRVKATASVRVAEATASSVNLALNTDSATHIFPMALAYWSAGNNNPYQALKGQTAGSTSADDRWSDWELNTHHTDPKAWMGVAFETSTESVTRASGQVLTLVPKTVNKAKVMFVDEDGGTTGSVTFPGEYLLQYYTGPVTDLTFDARLSSNESGIGNGQIKNWTNTPLNDNSNWANVTVKGNYPAVPSANGNMLEIEFEPVSTAILRVLVTPKENKWVGIQALEVYGLNPPAAHQDFTATVTLGSETLRKSDFTRQSTGVYVLERQLAAAGSATEGIPQLAVTATDNAATSVVQAVRVPGLPEAGGAWARATVTSEDGSKTETYTVKFTRQGATSGYFMEVDPQIPTDKISFVDADGRPVSGGAPNTQIFIKTAGGYQAQVWVEIIEGDRLGESLPITNGSFYMPAASVHVYGSATPIPYTIECILDGGNPISYPGSYNVERETFSIPDPTKPGYTFVGWVGGGLTTPTKGLRIEKGSVGNRTYTAVWQASGSIGGGGGNNGGGGGGGVTVPVGDVTVTTKNPDGSTTVTTTSGGLVSAVTTATDGTQSAVIQVPQNSGSSVDAVMPALDVSAEKAPEVTVENNTGRPLSVTLPINGSDTVVAVRQNADGTETVIPYSVVDENGLRVKVESGDQTLRLVDNAKSFEDVPDSHWASAAVDFASSRELFNGMGSAETFAPAAPMDRAMMTTVLWRLAEKPNVTVTQLFDDVRSGEYYEQAVAWGVAAGVVKGTDNGFEPNTPITRETLAVMLYRAAGSPTVVDELPRRFTDGAQVADWSQAAMIWCIQNDIITGYPDSTLAPRNAASRAEVAAMLRRFVEHQV